MPALDSPSSKPSVALGEAFLTTYWVATCSGRTQAATVRADETSSASASGIETLPVAPSNRTADRPPAVTHVVPPDRAPTLPQPDVSAAASPVPSSRSQAPRRPSAGVTWTLAVATDDQSPFAPTRNVKVVVPT
ncbi:hypothetical protein D3C74_396420 [compost metagenome]